MTIRISRTIVVCTIIILLATAARVHAEEPLATARQLYAAAQYEDALRLLEMLPAGSYSGEDRQSVELYRSLCLLALGRHADAERAIDAIIVQDPLYRPGDDLSPRMRAAFSESRKRVLPAVMQQRYNDAKNAFDGKEFSAAAAGFRRVIDTLSEPELTALADQPPLSDLRTLAAGFHDLSVKAMAPPPPPLPPPPPRPAAHVPAPIYTGEEANVVPPVAIRQDLPKFPSSMRPGSIRGGIVEVVINEAGLVESSSIMVPTVAAYDKLLLAAALRWVYQPATVDGRPVKFRNRVQVNVSTPSR